MRWSVVFLLKAQSDMRQLDKDVRRRVLEKVEWFQINFDSLTPSVLTGEFREFYKLRVGDWRVFYKIDWREQLIIVCYIDRRDKAYKKH